MVRKDNEIRLFSAVPLKRECYGRPVPIMESCGPQSIVLVVVEAVIRIVGQIGCLVSLEMCGLNVWWGRHDGVKVQAGDEEDLYATNIVQFVSEADEIKEFFDRLDGELNKVNHFYRTQECEFLERGENLSKQLQILLDRKQALHDRRRKCFSDAGSLSRSKPSSLRATDYSESVADSEEPALPSAPATDDLAAALERNAVNFIGTPRSKTKKGKPKTALKIDIPATTSTWTIECSEKMIRRAFVELYKGLGLLKTYSSLNMVTFTKILKKFDKVSNQKASETYLKAVRRSYFLCSDKVLRLADDVESTFTEHFANNDRKKAMKYLKPQPNKASHMITFLVGLFTGSFVTLFVVYAILAHLNGIFSTAAEASYVEIVYPVFSMFSLLSLHVFLYGCNLFLWKATRINSNFIMDFSPSTALRYRDAFLMCTSFMTMVVGSMVIHLILRSKGFSLRQVDAIPGILFVLFAGLLFCPFNIFYRSTRYYFLRVTRNIICSPFCKVAMVDFFMADQLTSQVPLLRHMEFTACYFIAGVFKTHQYQTCISSKSYKELAYVISFMPYYWRAMQCARRWFDEGDINHVVNMSKYVSTMLAAGARLTFAMQPTPLWQAIVIVTSSVATVLQLYWDFVKDWGVLKPKSKNLWLRDELLLKRKSIYYVSIVFNFILRLTWVETVMHINIGRFNNRLLDFFLACLEIIRRGHWNFYRLEYEHLNNVGRFVAVKTVPLPFRETDSDN